MNTEANQANSELPWDISADPILTSCNKNGTGQTNIYFIPFVFHSKEDLNPASFTVDIKTRLGQL